MLARKCLPATGKPCGAFLYCNRSPRHFRAFFLILQMHGCYQQTAFVPRHWCRHVHSGFCQQNCRLRAWSQAKFASQQEEVSPDPARCSSPFSARLCSTSLSPHLASPLRSSSGCWRASPRRQCGPANCPLRRAPAWQKCRPNARSCPLKALQPLCHLRPTVADISNPNGSVVVQPTCVE